MKLEKKQGILGNKKIRTQIQAVIINKSLESEKLLGEEVSIGLLVIGYIGKEAKEKKIKWKGLSLSEKNGVRSSAFKTTGSGSVMWEASHGPNIGSQSKENSGQDDITKPGSVSLSSSGILPATTISEEIRFLDFPNEPSRCAGSQHTWQALSQA